MNCKGTKFVNEFYVLIFQGCDERKEEFQPNKPYYSAFRENDYGYTRLKAHNKTHLEFSQVSDDKVMPK